MLMVQAGEFANVFSFCLGHEDGQLYLGEIPAMTDSNTVWVPRVTTTDFYGVYIDDLLVGGKSIGVPPLDYN